MNNLKAWRWDWDTKYYLTHPWRLVQELFWNIKAAHQRSVKGYCNADWMNFADWFKMIAPNMLRDLAMKSVGYPGIEPFETPEKWESWLHRMADQIAKCQDDDAGNEYREAFMKMIDENPLKFVEGNITEEEKQLEENYCRRTLEIQEEHNKLFKETMYEMLEHWERLWD